MDLGEGQDRGLGGLGDDQRLQSSHVNEQGDGQDERDILLKTTPWEGLESGR